MVGLPLASKQHGWAAFHIQTAWLGCLLASKRHTTQQLQHKKYDVVQACVCLCPGVQCTALLTQHPTQQLQYTNNNDVQAMRKRTNASAWLSCLFVFIQHPTQQPQQTLGFIVITKGGS